ncbi:MAG: hypothetical protein BGN89_17640 [Alphaproteobacteria bacterium 64-6]|nr:MAG: hypothetical protein ABS54_14800 [Hyphomicrobium sp. SCN 65-11]OJU28285.1 MAG: hypothetical protein BGN89_17640 [Alphaproteobacteria bacterium 64-6]
MIIGAAAALSMPAAVAQNKPHDHKDHKHTHATPQHGGVLEDVGEYHAELVAKDGKLTIYLRDEEAKDTPAEGFKASVLLTAGSQRVGPIQLAPAGGNKLEGAANAIPAGATAILTLTDKSGATAQARYKLK